MEESNENQHFFQQQTVQVGYDHRFGDPCGSSCHVYFVCTRITSDFKVKETLTMEDAGVLENGVLNNGWIAETQGTSFISTPAPVKCPRFPGRQSDQKEPGLERPRRTDGYSCQLSIGNGRLGLLFG